MERPDAEESVPILERTMTALLAVVPSRGRPGSDVRRAVGDLLAHALLLLHENVAGQPMADCFELGRKAGITYLRFRTIRATTLKETPVTLGATLTKHALIQMCLAQ